MAELRTIPLDEIPHSTRLRYRDPLSRWAGADALRASVARAGVLEPVLLLRRDLEPAHGFRRLEAAREAGLAEVPARLADGEPPDLLLRAVEGHAGEGAPNLRERAAAMQAAMALGWSAGRTARRLLPALGLEPHAGLVSRHLRLLEFHPDLLDLLVRKGFSLRRAAPFAAFSAAEGAALTGALGGLGARRIEEAALALREVCARDGLGLAELLAALALEAGGPAALARLRDRRYPETAALRTRAEGLAAELGGEAARVEFDPNFARDGVELRARLDRPEDLRRLLEQLSGPDAAAVLERLLRELA